MNARSLLGLVVVFFLSATLSHAAVFERDWEDAPPGNGLLTYDDVNQREWLDVTETILADFRGDCDTFECIYQNVLAETAPGGMFPGFLPATGDDVIALAQSAGIDTSTLDFATNEVAASELVALLGPTVTSSAGSAITALTQEINPATNVRVPANISVSPSGAGLTLPSNFPGDGGATRFVGVFLHRKAIPEPSSCVVTGLLTVACFCLRKR